MKAELSRRPASQYFGRVENDAPSRGRIRTRRDMGRVAFMILALGVAACAARATGETCPRTSFSEFLRRTRAGAPQVDPEVCAAKLAAAVCRWDDSEYEERARTVREIERKSRDSHERGEPILIHEYHVRCGCLAYPVGRCFVKTAAKKVGRFFVRYVIATGAPGCDREVHPRSDQEPDDRWPPDVKVSGKQCGARGTEVVRILYDLHDGGLSVDEP